MSRQGTASSRRKSPGLHAARGQRKRKSWTFERLEDRFCFSAAPLEIQTINLSTDTPAGASATWLREMQWAAMQYAHAAGTEAPQLALFALPSDPMFVNQWHLLNTGQEVGDPSLQDLVGVAGEDLNVVPVWNMGITGDGVLVAVIDSGVQLFHPDLTGNISPTLRFNALNGTNNVSPDFIDPGGFHGTAVAGVIGAVADNGEGGVGVAPGVTLVPIKLIVPGETTDQAIFDAFQWALVNGIDITNNSWGFVGNNGLGREAFVLDPQMYDVLRESVINGRDGLGMIHVFASGNDGGPFFTGTFPGNIGNYDSSTYDAFSNSRYVITVTGVDHDGLYVNADGTFTTYPEAGANVLVAAPTGSNGFTSVGEDDGFGSGIWTTDLVGDFGRNAEPLPSGTDPDNDFWPDADYTSRFNGTSASAPMVSGVIALMLEANPNLTYRDVQEILVRSARQNAQFESPSSGGLSGELAAKNTWQTNQIQPFREVDAFDNPLYTDNFDGFLNPLADPNTDGFAFGGFNLPFYAPDSNDGNRQFNSQYEPQPPLFTNGVGYTVSQGYGLYDEQVGYGHGTVDAELAVKMALQWHNLDQNSDPGTERTFTTGVINQGPNTGWALPAGAKGSAPPNGINFLVPGGIGGIGGFIPYYNQFFVDDPFANYTGPGAGSRGASYLDFVVPPSQGIDVEWVEVRLELDGAGDDLDFLRIFLVSPEGTQSELNHFYGDPGLAGGTFSTQESSEPIAFLSPQGDINAGGSFLWTFSTNRNWGETTNSAVIIHPATGEPLLQDTIIFDPVTQLPIQSTEPIFRNWELHIENWSTTSYSLPITEIIWHGKPIGGGGYDINYAVQGVATAQRVQGFIAVDTNGDNEFGGVDLTVDNEFNLRYTQTILGSHSDVDTIRTEDIERQLLFDDENGNGILDYGVDEDTGILEPLETIYQEPFAENVIVEARRVFNGVVEANPVAQFLTGADGNYYFDLNVQDDIAFANSIGATFEYEISAIDPLGRAKLEDVDTPALVTSDPQFTYLPHYKQSWRINADWFYAPDRDNPLLLGNSPGEIFYDAATNAPAPFTNFGTLDRVPMAVKNVNFLLKQDALPQMFDVQGNVYADLNGNGQFDGDDAPVAGVFVYQDVNRNGDDDAGEPRVLTDSAGHYTLTIPATHIDTYAVGVIQPTPEWLFTDPGHDGVENVFAGPGSPTQTVNFFLDPPNSAFPPNGVGLGSIQGVVFNDLDADGTRDVGEGGVPNFRVFIDANANGMWESLTETSVLTASNGSFLFSNVTPDLIRLDVVIPNEGSPAAAWSLTTPLQGYHEVLVGPGGAVTGLKFGLDNRADSDWGDLPDSYSTTSTANGPRHFVTPGFQLGASIDGEVDGVPTPSATGEGLVGDSDDGVVVVSNGGFLVKGVNTLRVTVAGVGGLLTGWMDINADGHFDESERLTWTLAGNNLGGEADLSPGTFDLQVTIPNSAVDGPLAARFRWGEQGLTFTGAAAIGEVEDYRLGLNFLLGDYDRNGTVDQGDYLVWRFTQGQVVVPFAGADGNGDGVINAPDYDVWAAHFGQTLPPPAAGALALGSGGGSSSGDGAAATSAGSSAVAAGSVVESAPSDSVAVTVSGQAFAAFASDAGQGPTSQANAGLGQSSVANSASSNSNLLLLDLAWAGIDDTAYDVADDSLYDGSDHDDTHVSDLALAAVMTEESDWWDAI